jgi:hypothetical protein
MLGTIGEQPVNSLDISTVSEVSIASDMIYEVSREIQSRGWHFNEEWEYKLYASEGEIPLPVNTLKVHVTGPATYAPRKFIVRRGDRLYNRTDHTYTFTQEYVEADIVFFLPFTDLPQTARTYITLRAARKFQVRMLGSQEIEGFTEIEENQAWVNLLAEETDQHEYTMVDPRLRLNRSV